MDRSRDSAQRHNKEALQCVRNKTELLWVAQKHHFMQQAFKMIYAFTNLSFSFKLVLTRTLKRFKREIILISIRNPQRHCMKNRKWRWRFLATQFVVFFGHTVHPSTINMYFHLPVWRRKRENCRCLWLHFYSLYHVPLCQNMTSTSFLFPFSFPLPNG